MVRLTDLSLRLNPLGRTKKRLNQSYIDLNGINHKTGVFDKLRRRFSQSERDVSKLGFDNGLRSSVTSNATVDDGFVMYNCMTTLNDDSSSRTSSDSEGELFNRKFASVREGRQRELAKTDRANSRKDSASSWTSQLIKSSTGDFTDVEKCFENQESGNQVKRKKNGDQLIITNKSNHKQAFANGIANKTKDWTSSHLVSDAPKVQAELDFSCKEIDDNGIEMQSCKLEMQSCDVDNNFIDQGEMKKIINDENFDGKFDQKQQTVDKSNSGSFYEEQLEDSMEEIQKDQDYVSTKEILANKTTSSNVLGEDKEELNETIKTQEFSSNHLPDSYNRYHSEETQNTISSTAQRKQGICEESGLEENSREIFVTGHQKNERSPIFKIDDLHEIGGNEGLEADGYPRAACLNSVEQSKVIIKDTAIGSRFQEILVGGDSECSFEGPPDGSINDVLEGSDVDGRENNEGNCVAGADGDMFIRKSDPETALLKGIAVNLDLKAQRRCGVDDSMPRDKSTAKTISQNHLIAKNMSHNDFTTKTMSQNHVDIFAAKSVNKQIVFDKKVLDRQLGKDLSLSNSTKKSNRKFSLKGRSLSDENVPHASTTPHARTRRLFSAPTLLQMKPEDQDRLNKLYNESQGRSRSVSLKSALKSRQSSEQNGNSYRVRFDLSSSNEDLHHLKTQRTMSDPPPLPAEPARPRSKSEPKKNWRYVIKKFKIKQTMVDFGANENKQAAKIEKQTEINCRAPELSTTKKPAETKISLESVREFNVLLPAVKTRKKVESNGVEKISTEEQCSTGSARNSR